MYHEKFIRKHANRFLKNLNLEGPMATYSVKGVNCFV